MLCPLEFYLISILLDHDTKETSKPKFDVRVHTEILAFCLLLRPIASQSV